MSVEENKAVVRRFYEELWNKGNTDVIPDLLQPDAVMHDPTSPDLVPLTKISPKLVPAERNAFPDIHFDLQDIIGEGDTVFIHWTVTGTHEGDYLGLPGTGTKVKVCGMGMFKFRNGKIAEMWLNMDDLGLRQQLGIV